MLFIRSVCAVSLLVRDIPSLTVSLVCIAENSNRKNLSWYRILFEFGAVVLKFVLCVFLNVRAFVLTE